MSAAKVNKPRDRIHVSVSVMLRNNESPQPYIFTTENISASGILIQGEREDYPFDDFIPLQAWLYPFEGDNTAITFNARIARWDGLSGLGLEITEIDDTNSKRLHAFIGFCRVMGKS